MSFLEYTTCRRIDYEWPCWRFYSLPHVVSFVKKHIEYNPLGVGVETKTCVLPSWFLFWSSKIVLRPLLLFRTIHRGREVPFRECERHCGYFHCGVHHFCRGHFPWFWKCFGSPFGCPCPYPCPFPCWRCPYPC